jgi:hypothetical protein
LRVSRLLAKEGIMHLELEESEVASIINVLGELPTKSNAWPLAQKIVYQYEQQKEDDSADVGGDSEATV